MSAAPMTRCPKHGTLLVGACAEYPVPWCWPCWSRDGRRLPGPDVEGGRLAMSRFLAFVWAEADAREWAYDAAVTHDMRAASLGRAVSLGLLRLEGTR